MVEDAESDEIAPVQGSEVKGQSYVHPSPGSRKSGPSHFPFFKGSFLSFLAERIQLNGVSGIVYTHANHFSVKLFMKFCLSKLIK
jgi:hypothetical protein